jgi:hypothetical protein
MARNYDKNRRGFEFEVNDRVLRKNYVLSSAAEKFMSKLAPKFIGPFVVSRKISPVSYSLQNLQGKNVGNWHVSQLKPYVTRNV